MCFLADRNKLCRWQWHKLSSVCLSIACNVYIVIKRYAVRGRRRYRSIHVAISNGLAAIFNAKFPPASTAKVRQLLAARYANGAVPTKKLAARRLVYSRPILATAGLLVIVNNVIKDLISSKYSAPKSASSGVSGLPPSSSTNRFRRAPHSPPLTGRSAWLGWSRMQ